MNKVSNTHPFREVRAAFDDHVVVVYQAFSPEIAEPALKAGRFVPPFRYGRMTWIKPSFLWMMYRSGWASKPGQDRILAIRLYRPALDSALSRACLTGFEPSIYRDFAHWTKTLRKSTVRVQWDPERSLTLERLPWRTIQIGLTPEAIRSYNDEWISSISDITDLAHKIHDLVISGDFGDATRLLPLERPYPAGADVARMIGI